MDCSWYEYQTTELHDGKTYSTYVEKYVVASRDGEKIIFDYYKNGEKQRQVAGNVSYANGHMRNHDLKKEKTETIRTAFGEKTVDVYSAKRCGGASAAYIGDDNLMFRGINTQMWSRGVICEIVMELVNYG